MTKRLPRQSESAARRGGAACRGVRFCLLHQHSPLLQRFIPLWHRMGAGSCEFPSLTFDRVRIPMNAVSISCLKWRWILVPMLLRLNQWLIVSHHLVLDQSQMSTVSICPLCSVAVAAAATRVSHFRFPFHRPQCAALNRRAAEQSSQPDHSGIGYHVITDTV